MRIVLDCALLPAAVWYAAILSLVPPRVDAGEVDPELQLHTPPMVIIKSGRDVSIVIARTKSTFGHNLTIELGSLWGGDFVSLHFSSVSLRTRLALEVTPVELHFADSSKTKSPSKCGEEGTKEGEENKRRSESWNRRRGHRGAAKDGVSLARRGGRGRCPLQGRNLCHKLVALA